METQTLTRGDFEAVAKTINPDFTVVVKDDSHWALKKGDQVLVNIDDESHHHIYARNANFVDGVDDNQLTKLFKLMLDYETQFTHYRDVDWETARKKKVVDEF